MSEQHPERRPGEPEPGQQPPATPPPSPQEPAATPPQYGEAPQSAPPPYGQPPQPAPQQYGQQPPAYGQYPSGAAAGGYSTELSPADQRMWAMLAHLGGIILGFIAPLIVFLVYKDRGAYVKEQSTEALNFQIMLAIAYVISFILWFVIIGMLLTFVVAIINIVFPILAAVAVNKGENYRYPINWRLVK